jgi:diguanylate cyclase (GGDEF)-like protein
MASLKLPHFQGKNAVSQTRPDMPAWRSAFTSFFHRHVDGVRLSSQEMHDIQAKAAVQTLVLLRWVACLSVPIHLAAAWWFGSADRLPVQPDELTWAQGLVRAHLVSAALVTLVVLWVTYALRRGRLGRFTAIAMQITVSCLYIFLSALISLSGIRSGTGTALTFMLVCMSVGTLSPLRPALAFPLFTLSFFLFAQAVNQLHGIGFSMATLRVNLGTTYVVVLLVSGVVWRYYSQMTVLYKKASELAEQDALTGLFNRRYITQRTQDALGSALRMGCDTHVILIDIDFFKKINDTYGHPGGDMVLQKLGALLLESVRGTDVAARWGGEEFMVLLPNTSQENAVALAEKLRLRLAECRWSYQNKTILVTGSFGVSGVRTEQVGDFDALFAAADKALYRAKQQGRNQVLYEPCDCPSPSSGFQQLRRET